MRMELAFGGGLALALGVGAAEPAAASGCGLVQAEMTSNSATEDEPSSARGFMSDEDRHVGWVHGVDT